MTVQEKAKTFLKDQWKIENEIIKNQIDGQIRVNPYGNVEFDFFKDENDEKNVSYKSNENKEESGVSNIYIFYLLNFINFKLYSLSI